MKRIVIITDSYFPKALANGICVHQIALALKDLGYEVHIICYKKNKDKDEDIYDGFYIHRVRQRLFFALRQYGEDNHATLIGKLCIKISMTLNKVKKLMYIPFYPMTSPLFIWRYYKRADELLQNDIFDIVLSVYNPLEAFVSGIMLKKKYPDIKFGIYVLDSLTNDAGTKFASKKWTDRKGWQWEKRGYKYADIIMNMKCHEQHHMQSRYDLYRHKMKIVDIPLLRELQFNKENYFDKKYTHFIYTGALGLHYRNPKYLCELFLSLFDIESCILHFYSRGCDDLIDNYQNMTNNRIINHGYLDHIESLKATCDADYLISIGNSNSDMIPSKIFEYMSTGKPIIHLYKRERDSCLPYYREYPNVLLINENDDKVVNIKKFEDFLRLKKKDIPFEEIKKKFIKNTPEFTAEFINKMLIK